MEMDKPRCKGQFFWGSHKKVTRQRGNIGDVMGGGRCCEAGMSMSLAALVFFSMVSMLFDRLGLRSEAGVMKRKRGESLGGS
eukprot:scaffold53460_cov105-Cyclotella_meneghiniana.AAC.3